MAITRTTIRPEAWRARLLPTALLTLAITLTGYCGMWLWREADLIDLHAAARSIRDGRPVSTMSLAGLIPDVLMRDARRQLGAEDLDDAALVVSSFADRYRDSALLRPPLLASADHLLRKRLDLAPADGNSWLRLAYIRTLRFGLDAPARRALRMSWLVNPREFSVMWPGLKFRVEHWSEMEPAEKDVAADLVVGLCHKPPARPELLQYWARLPVNQRAEILSRIRHEGCRRALSAKV